MKQKVQITESELYNVIQESIVAALNESLEDEGFLKNFRAGLQAAKQGYNTQKMMDRGTEGFKTEHDREDMAKQANPFGPGMENTAGEQATELLRQAKMYQAKANQLRAMANKMTSKYGLAKTAVNQRVDPSVERQSYTPAQPGYQAPGRVWKSQRQFKPDVQSTGLWGK